MESEISMDLACEEINISKATLSRIERGRTFDLETFVKVLNWLEENSDEFIN